MAILAKVLLIINAGGLILAFRQYDRDMQSIESSLSGRYDVQLLTLKGDLLESITKSESEIRGLVATSLDRAETKLKEDLLLTSEESEKNARDITSQYRSVDWLSRVSMNIQEQVFIGDVASRLVSGDDGGALKLLVPIFQVRRSMSPDFATDALLIGQAKEATSKLGNYRIIAYAYMQSLRDILSMPESEERWKAHVTQIKELLDLLG